MKKVFSLVIALVLTLSVFVMPTTAATDTKTCDIPMAIKDIGVDGVNTDGEWDGVPTNTGFKVYNGKDSEAKAEFSASFQAMWRKDGAKAYLYVLLTVADTKLYTGTTWNQDAFCISVDENSDGTPELKAPTMYILQERAWTSDDQKKSFGCDRLTYKGVVAADNSGYTVEMKYEFKDATNCTESVLIDIGVQDNNTGSNYVRYEWSNGHASNDLGSFVPKATGNLIAIRTAFGAGMRIAENLNETGLRFETHIDKATYDALAADENVASVKTGTLILPTDYLTSNSVEFTKAALDAKGVTYLDVVNEGWAKTTDSEYVFFGSITNIKTGNHARAFSGVGYIEIEYTDGTTEVFYGGYSASAHSRDVKNVATAAYNDTEAGYSTKTLEVLATYAEIEK